MTKVGKAHPDCRNASNPYHECSEYCFGIIAQAKKQLSNAQTGNCSDKGKQNMTQEGRVHPDCRNASNPYHECNDYCFRIIVEAKKERTKAETGVLQANNVDAQPHLVVSSDGGKDVPDERYGAERHNDADHLADGNMGKDEANLTWWNKNLRLKMNEARKANLTTMVAEKKKMEAPPESWGMSKQEERKKKIGKLLDASGLDMSKAYMLDTQESTEAKYKKWEKEPDSAGWDGNCSDKGKQNTTKKGRVYPDCRNASNPYHECNDYCFGIIVEAKKQRSKAETGLLHAKTVDVQPHLVGGEDVPDVSLECHIYQLNEARKANQSAMVGEKKKTEAPPESMGMSKQKLMEEKKKKIEKLLDANGLDMSKAYMLDTQESAEAKYKKWEKKPAPAGWDVFNQKYDAYKQRTKTVDVDLDEYKMKEVDPEFCREASSLQYGKAPKISQDKIEKMVKELKDRDEKRQSMIHPNIFKLTITRLKELLYP